MEMENEVATAVPGERKILGRADILSSQDSETLDVFIKEWGGMVRFRSLTAREAIDFQDGLKNEGEKSNAWVTLFAISAIGADGKPLFTKDDVEGLKNKRSRPFLRMQGPLLEFNGFKDAEEKAKKA